MSNWIFNVGVLGALFVLTIVTTPIVILAITLRFISTARSGRKLGREDWLAFSATVVHVIYCALTLTSKFSPPYPSKLYNFRKRLLETLHSRRYT